ncbi:MAG: DMT family transporter [Armatimonadetes bacterium]|nr:DMT family transporter [Armatimonadota bacterium]
MTNTGKGIGMGLVAAAFWGSTQVAIKLLYDASLMGPVAVTFYRFVIGGAALAAVLAAQRQGSRLTGAVRDPLPFAWLGVTGIAGMGFLVALGTELTTATNVSLIMNANPVFVALLGPLFGERLSGWRLGGTAVGLAGVSIVVLGAAHSGATAEGARHVWGALASVGAALGWAFYTLRGKAVVARYGGLLTTTGAMLWGALLIAPLFLAAPATYRLSPGSVSILIYLGLAPSALAFALWYRALALVDAAALAPTQYVAPPVTVLLAWLLLRERVDAAFIIGLVLIFAGIALASREAAQRPSPERP